MTRTFMLKLILTSFLFLMIVGCTIDEKAIRESVAEDALAQVEIFDQRQKKEATAAIAILLDDSGAVVGKALFSSEPEGMKIKVTLAAINAQAGEHRLQFHKVGSCYPNFNAAGEPIEISQQLATSDATNKEEILPPLVLSRNGSASYEAITDQVTFSSGEIALFDDDGSAIVLHESSTNDSTEKPAKRLVCGVVELQLSSLDTTN